MDNFYLCILIHSIIIQSSKNVYFSPTQHKFLDIIFDDFFFIYQKFISNSYFWIDTFFKKCLNILNLLNDYAE